MMGAHFEEGRGGDKAGPANESLTPDAAMRQADAAAEAPGAGGDEAVAGLVRAVRTLLPVVPAHSAYGNVATAVQLVRNALARVSDASPQTVDVCGGKRLQSAVAAVLRLYQQEQQDPMSLMSRLRAAHEAPRAYLEGFVTEYETIVRSLGNIANALGMPPVPFRLVEGVQAILERARAVAELIKRAKEHECETFPRESCEHLSAANIVSDLAAMDPDEVVDGAGAGARPATADEHEEAIQGWVNRVEKADGFERVGSGSCDLTMSEAEWRELRDEALRLMRSDRGPGDRVPGLHFCSYSKETGTLHVHFKDASGAMRVRVNDRLTQIRNGDEVVGFVAFRLHEPYWAHTSKRRIACREVRDQLEAAKSAETAIEAASDALREAGILEFDTVAAGVRTLLEDLRRTADLLLQAGHGQAIAELEAVAALASVGDWFGIEQNVKERLAVLRSDGKAKQPNDLKRTDAHDCTAILRQLLREVRDRIERFGRLDSKKLIWVTYVNVEAMLLRAIAEVARQSRAEPEQPEDGVGGKLSMVQCDYHDPDVVPMIVDALDELDSRVRTLEGRR